MELQRKVANDRAEKILGEEEADLGSQYQLSVSTPLIAQGTS